jgi:hypothetical protein
VPERSFLSLEAAAQLIAQIPAGSAHGAIVVDAPCPLPANEAPGCCAVDATHRQVTTFAALRGQGQEALVRVGLADKETSRGIPVPEASVRAYLLHEGLQKLVQSTKSRTDPVR